MSNVNNYIGFYHDTHSPLARPAQNAAERKTTLTHWINNNWSMIDIGKIERLDDAANGQHGWHLWDWKP